MGEDTLWTLLLSGVLWFMRNFALPLFGDPSSEVAALDFGRSIFASAQVVLTLIWYTIGSVVNLDIFAVFLSTMLVVFFMKIALSAGDIIKGFIPIIGGSK